MKLVDHGLGSALVRAVLTRIVRMGDAGSDYKRTSQGLKCVVTDGGVSTFANVAAVRYVPCACCGLVE